MQTVSRGLVMYQRWINVSFSKVQERKRLKIVLYGHASFNSESRSVHESDRNKIHASI